MATTRRRNFFRRRGGGGKPEYGWTACDPTGFSVNAATTAVVILAGSDWARGSGVSQSATLQRIRGGFSWQGTASAITRAYIARYDEGETVDSAALITTYFNEDILWTWTRSSAANADATPQPSEYVPIDIKVRRKLTLDSTIQLVFTGSAATAAFVVPVIRALVRFS